MKTRTGQSEIRGTIVAGYPRQGVPELGQDVRIDVSTKTPFPYACIVDLRLFRRHKWSLPNLVRRGNSSKIKSEDLGKTE